jgi:hypothetical protein
LHYLEYSSKAVPDANAVKRHLDIVTHKAVYEVIDPINENLELDGIGLLRSLLSIVALSKDELILTLKKEKDSFSNVTNLHVFYISKNLMVFY